MSHYPTYTMSWFLKRANPKPRKCAPEKFHVKHPAAPVGRVRRLPRAG